jgi:EthD domain
VRTVFRRRDLTHHQFKDYWLKNHARLEDRVIAESPVQRIVATFALTEPGRDPAFDGIVELYFASAADLRTMFAGPIPAIRVVCEERVSGN